MTIAPEIYKRIVAAKVYIDANFRDSIDLSRLSREACLSRFYFHRLFRRVYQRTPHQYITRLRIRQARQYLAEDAMTIAEICHQVGFESIGSFSVLFKKEIGRPPLRYRHQEWQKKHQSKEMPASMIPHCFIERFKIAVPDLKSNFQEVVSGPIT